MTTLETMHEAAMKNYEEKNLDKALEIYNEIIRLNPIDEVALACVRDIYEERMRIIVKGFGFQFQQIEKK